MKNHYKQQPKIFSPAPAVPPPPPDEPVTPEVTIVEEVLQTESPISEQTRLEMEVGRQRVAEHAEARRPAAFARPTSTHEPGDATRVEGFQNNPRVLFTRTT